MNTKNKFRELNLCDNFLFSAVMEDPETCREVLKLLLKIEIAKVIVATEKTMVFNPEQRGIRMDVYAADEQQTVYNVEMQTTNEGNLPKRSRYYQSQIDVGRLKSGENYNKLPRSFIIFICTFDPFGYGRYLYTVGQWCMEEEFVFTDDTVKIFLNTKGTNTVSADTELIYFLKYVEHSTKELVDETDSNFLRKLHNRVAKIKYDREMEERYMLFEELMAKREAEGIRQGIEQGIRQGERIILKLIAAMYADGRSAEIARLSEDQEFFDEMIIKYRIKK